MIRPGAPILGAPWGLGGGAPGESAHSSARHGRHGEMARCCAVRRCAVRCGAVRCGIVLAGWLCAGWLADAGWLDNDTCAGCVRRVRVRVKQAGRQGSQPASPGRQTRQGQARPGRAGQGKKAPGSPSTGPPPRGGRVLLFSPGGCSVHTPCLVQTTTRISSVIYGVPTEYVPTQTCSPAL